MASSVNRVHHLRGLQRAVSSVLRCANCHVFLDLSDSLRRVQTLRACPRAVKDRVATVQGECILEHLAALVTLRVTRVRHPAVGLHQDSRAEVGITVPPVRWARSGTAGTENALVETIETATLLWGLEILLAIRRRASGLQVRLDRAVLLVELSQVRHQVLDNVGVGQGVDLRVRALAVDAAKAGKRVDTVDVHGTAAANSLTA